MKNRGYLVPLILLFNGVAAYPQLTRSTRIEMEINNLPDTLPPEIIVHSPPLEHGNTFRAGEQSVELRGEVTDDHAVRIFAVNGKVRNLNEDGGFRTPLYLYPGRNELRLVAVDSFNNMAENFIILEYRPDKRATDKILPRYP